MEVVGGIPVECLTPGELAGVWSGWTCMGDREVVREASAKGNHINLAFKFLAYRRHWTIDEAQNFFYAEVEIWINELLNKTQIHRASHILQKIGKDPIVYIKEICTKSKDPELRDYLANHVMKNDGFTEEQVEAWETIKCIKKYEETAELSSDTLDGHSIENISIEEMLNLPSSIKYPLITELYFHTYEKRLSKKLKSSVVWNYLLAKDEVELLIKWIDRKFSDQNDGAIDETESELLEVFDRLEITAEMIDNIEQSGVSFPIKDMVLNQLCTYGIFNNKEKNDMKLILSRFFNATIIPEEFDEILSKKTCNLDKNEFLRRKHSILYYQNEENIDEDLYLKDMKLLESFKRLNNPENIERNMISAICQSINKISDDPVKYLMNEPLISFYLILLKYLESKKSGGTVTLKELLISEDNVVLEDIEIPVEIKNQLLDKIPYLRDCIENREKKEEMNMYQLLDGFENLNVNELFRWRFQKEPMPHFACDKLIKKYGHQEKLTYKYYLREARPCMAAHVLLDPDGKQGNLSSEMKSKIAFQTHVYALKHLNSPDIVCTCICFIEFLGVDSECLRLHATAADYVQNKLHITINDLLESVAYQNGKDLTILMTHLEHSFALEFTAVSMDNVSKFMEALKSWDFIVRFARAHNTVLPDSLLKNLAINDCWFEFALVGDIFHYPLEQMLENASHFEDPHLRDHLLIALSNSRLSLQNSSSNLQKPKQSRQITSKHSHKVSSPPPSSSSTASPQSHLKSYHSPPSTHRASSSDQDLWLTILDCHRSQDPPGALLKAALDKLSPVLIVLATCYEPSSTAVYCYSWLLISTEDSHLINDYINCFNYQMWSVREVSQLFRRLMSLGYVDTLARGFEIFLPNSSLHLFFKFLRKCIKFCDFETSQNILIDFINNCSTLKSNRTIDWDDYDITYLNNEYWIVIVCIECIIAALDTNFRSTHLKCKFLNLLIDSNFNEELHVKEPDCQLLLNIITILSKTPVKIELNRITLIDKECGLTQEVERCIKELMEIENFTAAIDLSKTANLPCSFIILEKYRNECRKRLNNPERFTSTFWKECSLDILKYDVSFEDAVSFFIEQAEKVESCKERYEILELAWKTLKPIATDQQTIDTVEMAMWKACILAGPAAIEILREKKTFCQLNHELLASISNLRVSCSLNDESEEQAIQALIDRFLDIDDLETALRISAIFNYKHRSLQIVMLCLSLAEGETSPYQLTFLQKFLLTESTTTKSQRLSTLTNRGFPRRLSSSSLNLSSPTSGTEASEINPIVQQIQNDCTELLEKLVKNLEHGLNIGNKVLVLYKLSTNLKRDYRTLLVSRDPMEMLYEITGINCPKKFDLINDVISAYRISNTEVTKFLAGEIVMYLTRQIEENLDETMLMWGYPLDVNLRLITDLCNDPSLLGWQLLKAASMRLGRSSLGSHRDVSILKITVELLIRAHDYFTASCSMEGIASVLKKSQQLANTLQNLKLWSLLVRLVTGVGRFIEMNYVLQILKENDQFEFLLGIGTDKISGLKIALLEFCKKYYPNDKELFTLICHHFRLYNEIAVMWESEAVMIIRDLIRETRKENIRALNINPIVKFTKNENTEKRLHCAMTNFTHATEYYLRDNKLNLANKCCNQAQLVALQVSLFNGVNQNQQVVCLLNLTADEINKIMCQGLNFSQAMILVKCYNDTGDWSYAIYHHVIVNGEIKYLRDFLASKRLTNAIVQECICRYRMEKSINKLMTVNMECLISELDDIEAKYVFASQLGFKDIVQGLLANESSRAYLKDTVWKQGFKPHEFIGEMFRG